MLEEVNESIRGNQLKSTVSKDKAYCVWWFARAAVTKCHKLHLLLSPRVTTLLVSVTLRSRPILGVQLTWTQDITSMCFRQITDEVPLLTWDGCYGRAECLMPLKMRHRNQRGMGQNYVSRVLTRSSCPLWSWFVVLEQYSASGLSLGWVLTLEGFSFLIWIETKLSQSLSKVVLD